MVLRRRSANIGRRMILGKRQEERIRECLARMDSARIRVGHTSNSLAKVQDQFNQSTQESLVDCIIGDEQFEALALN